MQIHLISIGGAVMHQLAIALHKMGHVVSGSDDEIFDPARTNLEKLGLLPENLGWYPEKIHDELDIVILGMHARSDNPELLSAEKKGLRVYSFPEFIYNHSINKKRVVIAGSHGKTTVTSMVMHVLRTLGREFDYLVGAKLEGFDQMVKISDAELIIIEGDEYLASCRKPEPKIFFYKPHITAITGLSWDHINVFPTKEIYVQQFEKYVNNLDDQCIVFYNEADVEVKEFAQKFKDSNIIMPYNLPEYTIENGHYHVKLEGLSFELAIIGKHNLNNMQAAQKICAELGISARDFYQNIVTYKGAAKRLERIFDGGDKSIFLDFAHAPSKVKASLAAIHELFPHRRKIAVLELHTYSSLNKQFLPEYASSLDLADDAIVFYSPHTFELKKLQKLDPETVRSCFEKDDIMIIESRDALWEWLKNQNWKDSCLLLMSSGNFDGINLSDICTFMAEN